MYLTANIDLTAYIYLTAHIYLTACIYLGQEYFTFQPFYEMLETARSRLLRPIEIQYSRRKYEGRETI